MKYYVTWIAATLVASMTAPVLGQLPPPPPPGFPNYVQDLQDAYNSHSLKSYGMLFDDKVKVYIDGLLVASDRTSYMSFINAEFGNNITIQSLSWAQGSQILVMDQIMGCVPAKRIAGDHSHPCFRSRAVRYDIGNDKKITAVHVLTADQTWNIHPSGG